MVVIFNSQNSHLLTLSLPTEEVFQVNGQNRLVANLPVVDFHSQTREMLTPKPLNTQLSVFLLAYWFFPLLGKFEPHSLSAITIFQCFSRHNSRKLQQTTCIENRGGFAVHQPDRVAPKANDVSAADWLYQHTLENTTFFHVCCYSFSQGRKSLYNTTVHVINAYSTYGTFSGVYIVSFKHSREVGKFLESYANPRLRVGFA